MNNKKETSAERALRKEYERLQRNCGINNEGDNVNEAFSSSFHPTGSMAQTVSTIGAGNNQWGNTTDITGKLRPEEALNVAIFRVLSGGAPVNNVSFYDEINWHLSKLGFPSKLPLDIKQAMLKMVTG